MDLDEVYESLQDELRDKQQGIDTRSIREHSLWPAYSRWEDHTLSMKDENKVRTNDEQLASELDEYGAKILAYTAIGEQLEKALRDPAIADHLPEHLYNQQFQTIYLQKDDRERTDDRKAFDAWVMDNRDSIRTGENSTQFKYSLVMDADKEDTPYLFDPKETYREWSIHEHTSDYDLYGNGSWEEHLWELVNDEEIVDLGANGPISHVCPEIYGGDVVAFGHLSSDDYFGITSDGTTTDTTTSIREALQYRERLKDDIAEDADKLYDDIQFNREHLSLDHTPSLLTRLARKMRRLTG